MAKKPRRRLSEISEGPVPSPEARAAAQKADAKIVAWDPARLRKFVLGKITLSELEGIPKDAQYEMAKIGHRYFKSGDLDLAHRIFLGLSVLDPYDAYFHTALGSIAQQRLDKDEAVRRYTRALQINPKASAALANRGEIYLERGKLEAAEADLRKAVEADPQSTLPTTQRARALLTALETRRNEAKSR